MQSPLRIGTISTISSAREIHPRLHFLKDGELPPPSGLASLCLQRSGEGSSNLIMIVSSMIAFDALQGSLGCGLPFMSSSSMLIAVGGGFGRDHGAMNMKIKDIKVIQLIIPIKSTFNQYSTMTSRK